MVHGEPQADLTGHPYTPYKPALNLASNSGFGCKSHLRWSDHHAEDTRPGWVGSHLLKTNIYMPKNYETTCNYLPVHVWAEGGCDNSRTHFPSLGSD
jgi:hypothetical protein